MILLITRPWYANDPYEIDVLEELKDALPHKTFMAKSKFSNIISPLTSYSKEQILFFCMKSVAADKYSPKNIPHCLTLTVA